MEILLDNINESEKVHKCIGVRVGESIIFKCPKCSYIRVLNIRNNRTFSKNDIDWRILHTGTFAKNIDVKDIVLNNN